MTASSCNGGLVNGILVALGVIGVLDNVVFHWLLRWHRLVPGAESDIVEPMIVVLSGGLFGLGLVREWRARRS